MCLLGWFLGKKDNGTSSSKETLSITYTSNFNSVINAGILQTGAYQIDTTESSGGGELNSYYEEVNVTYTP